MANSAMDVYQAVVAELDDIVLELCNKTATKISKDFNREAKNAITAYYNAYNPSSYRRTYTLYHSFYPYQNVKNASTVSAGVRFDSSALDGKYFSNSRYHQSGSTWVDYSHRSNKRNNGRPESDWIMDNLLEGVHPIYEFNGETYEDASVFTRPTPFKRMTDFVDKYTNGELQSYMQNEFFNLCLKYF